MNIVGIIAEFNPFHAGHAYLIQQAKDLTQSEFAVIIMNGDFVQRGEPAIFSKYERTKTALKGGADLVLELPVRFGISSAGDFALGGVQALAALGFVTHLAFGSECGDIRPLQEAASVLAEESPAFRTALSLALKEGLSFPAARAHALAATSSVSPFLLEGPNNILGIEYCLALQKISSPMTPVTIFRKGQGYHESTLPGEIVPENYPSATALRRSICDSGTPHLTLDDLSGALGYALLQSRDLTKYKDISASLADRIRHYIPEYRTVSELVQQCQTRAFTEGRIRRALMQCLLGIGITDPSVPYLRLLGMQAHAGSLLSQIPDTCCMISRLARDIKRLDSDTLYLLQQDLFAADLFRQTWCRKYDTCLPNEFQHSPILIKQ